MFLLLIGWTPMDELPQCLNLNPHTGFQPIYLHNDPLVLLFGEVYQIHVVVNEVFQTAMKISVWPNWPLRLEGLVCSHTHLCIVRKKHKQNTQADNIWMFFCFCPKSANKNRPCHGPSGWMSVGSAPTVCFCPLWGWGECRDAPQWCGASAGHLTGCPETPDAGW